MAVNRSYRVACAQALLTVLAEATAEHGWEGTARLRQSVIAQVVVLLA